MWQTHTVRAQGSGLSSKQISLCDDFIYIAQYGAGTASLNVSTAAAIVLHHFALWAAYPEQGRDAHKYIVAETPLKAHATGDVCRCCLSTRVSPCLHDFPAT